MGRMITFGVKPTRAETGYGYLEMASEIQDYHPRALPLKAFVEKPEQAKAEEFFAGHRHVWNAGIFMFRVADILNAFETLALQLMLPVRRAVDGA